MKHFLYLDTDIVNSIIAQSNQGLIQSITSENGSNNTESESSKISSSIDAEVGGSFATLAKAEASLSGNLELLDSDSSTSTSREIISITMHDAAFNEAYEILKPIKIVYGDQNADDTGNYIEITRVFDFIDFDYLEGLFDKDGIIDFIKKNSAEQIETEAEKAKELYNREQLRKISNTLKKEVSKAVNISNKQFDDIATIIKALRSLIPYNHLLTSYDGYLIALNEKYFRVDPVDLGFKYGGEITCVGMITNIIGKDTNPNDNRNLFATIQFTANEVLRKFLPTSKNNICVIHPIAVYYGE